MIAVQFCAEDTIVSSMEDEPNTPPQKEPSKDSDIIYFPSLAERDKRRHQEKERQKEKEEAEQQWRTEYRQGSPSPQSNPQNVPFFNLPAIPPFTRYFAFALIGIHVIMSFLVSDVLRHDLYQLFGFMPAAYTVDFGYNTILGPLTHALIHHGWLHIGFNMVMLLALGKFYESEFGTRQMIQMFFTCVFGGAVLHFALNPFSDIPVIGASGGISGLFAVMLMIFYKRGMVGALGKKGPWPLIGFWIGLMIFMGILSGPNTAWVAHLGGFLSGLLYLSYSLRGDLKFWQI